MPITIPENLSNCPGTANKFELGPASNLSRVTRKGARHYGVAARDWPGYTGTDVIYSDKLKAITLEPAQVQYDMLASGAAVSSRYSVTGNWEAVPVPGVGIFLHAYDAAAGATAKARSLYNLPRHQRLVCDVRHPQVSEETISAPQTFSLWFGAATEALSYRLDWGWAVEPKLYNAGALVTTLPVPESRMAQYRGATRIVWDMTWFGNDLHIACSAFDEPWIIPELGVSADGGPFPFSFQTTNGEATVNIYPVRYKTSGSFVTPTVEHYAPIGSTQPEIVGIYPGYYAGYVGVEISSAAQDGDGYQQQYTVALTSADAYHTPIIQAWQTLVTPTHSAPTETWTEFTSYVHDGRESIPDDTAQRSLDLNVFNAGGLENASSFAYWLENAAGLPGGLVTLRYWVGYRVDDDPDNDVRVPRGLLACRVRVEDLGIGEGSYPLRAVDPSRLWESMELRDGPCGQGMTVQDYLELLLEWVGVRPADCDWSDLPAATAGRTVDDPGRNYDSPAWMPDQGANAGEYIASFCEAFGLRLERNPFDGLLYVLPALYLADALPYNQPAFDITTASDGAPTATMQRIMAERALEQEAGKNTWYVDGKSGTGAPISAMEQDWNSLNTAGDDRYLMVEMAETTRNEDITDPAHAQEMARRKWRLSPLGLRTLQLPGVYNFWFYWPRFLGDLADDGTTAGGKRYRCTSVDTQLGREVNETVCGFLELRRGTRI
jgi:hypothetical protein